MALVCKRGGLYCKRRGVQWVKCIVTEAARLGRGSLYRNTNWVRKQGR